jgi:hypothetical protein
MIYHYKGNNTILVKFLIWGYQQIENRWILVNGIETVWIYTHDIVISSTVFRYCKGTIILIFWPVAVALWLQGTGLTTEKSNPIINWIMESNTITLIEKE